MAIASWKWRAQQPPLARDRGIPVVGFDLAGAEAGFPAIDHKTAYQHAHVHFLKKTVHSRRSIWTRVHLPAITECHADRIGHGTFLFSTEKVKDPAIKDPSEFVRCLVDYIASRRITMEVCPTSNLQTIPTITSVAEHPLRKMLDNNLSVSICTDNRLVSRTSVTRELELVCNELTITPAQLRNIILAGFKGSFFLVPTMKNARWSAKSSIVLKPLRSNSWEKNKAVMIGRLPRIPILLGLALGLLLGACRSHPPGKPDSELRIGVVQDYPPLVFRDKRQWQGIEVELAEALAQRLELAPRFLAFRPDQLIPALLDGKVDILMTGLTLTDERQVQIDFAMPYLVTGQALLIRPEHRLDFNTPHQSPFHKGSSCGSRGLTGGTTAQQLLSKCQDQTGSIHRSGC